MGESLEHTIKLQGGQGLPSKNLTMKPWPQGDACLLVGLFLSCATDSLRTGTLFPFILSPSTRQAQDLFAQCAEGINQHTGALKTCLRPKQRTGSFVADLRQAAQDRKPLWVV